jgi:hypothetical protein
MKVFGISLLTIAAVYAAYYVGRKNLAPFIPAP